MGSEPIEPGVTEREYLVTWSIEVFATDPVAAAVKAWLAVREAGSVANVFETISEGGRHIVDLSDQECRHCKVKICVDDDSGEWFTHDRRWRYYCQTPDGQRHEPHEPPDFPVGCELGNRVSERPVGDSRAFVAVRSSQKFRLRRLAMPKAVNISGGAGTVQTITGIRALHGVSVRESDAAPAAASVVVRDAIAGVAATDIAGTLALAANASRSMRFDPPLEMALGVRVTITGTVEGAVYVD